MGSFLSSLLNSPNTDHPEDPSVSTTQPHSFADKARPIESLDIEPINEGHHSVEILTPSLCSSITSDGYFGDTDSIGQASGRLSIVDTLMPRNVNDIEIGNSSDHTEPRSNYNMQPSNSFGFLPEQNEHLEKTYHSVAVWSLVRPGASLLRNKNSFNDYRPTREMSTSSPSSLEDLSFSSDDLSSGSYDDSGEVDALSGLDDDSVEMDALCQAFSVSLTSSKF